jgi:tetratricopeptide (TPR) repeat protein
MPLRGFACALACLLGACATSPRPLPGDAIGAPTLAAAAPSATVPAAAPGSPDGGESALTSEMLFRLMFGEIAVQRGESASAYTAFMTVARESHDPRVARRAVEVALGARAMAQALEASALWHTLAPDDADAAQSYASLLVATGHFEQARPLLERQMASAPQPLELLDRLQRVLMRAPQPEQGYALLESLSRPYIEAPATAFDAHQILARGALAAGRPDEAVSQARTALALRPDAETAVVALAQLLADPGPKGDAKAGGDELAGTAPDSGANHREALAMLERFLALHPDAPDARNVYARLLVGDGRLDEARAQFEALLERSPQSADPLFALGVLALESERYDDARSYLERYIGRVGPEGEHDLDLVYLDMARVAEGQRHFDEALDWLHKVHGTEQVDVARERRAFVLAHMNRVEEGLELLRAMPGTTDAQRTQRALALGQLLRDARRYQESYDLLDKALQSSPDDTGLLYETAMSAERLDRIDVMEKRLRHLLELRPDYAHAYNALGYSLADRNIRLQEAYQLIDRALALSPGDGFIMDSMGWVQYRMGNLAAARESLQRAFRLKADPDVAAHLAEVLWASGERSAARELLLDAQKRDGDSDTLRDTLHRLKIKP